MDPDNLTLQEILRLQTVLSEAIVRRFTRQMALVFSDIVGSTAYFAQFGNEAGRRQKQLHDDLIQSAAGLGNGWVVDTAGDGVFLCFPSVDGAIEAVLACCRQLADANALREHAAKLRVRQAIHWGLVITDGVTTASGDAVNFAKRVAESCAPGQVRLSAEAFREISKPQIRLTCSALPKVDLKGIAEPVELLNLEWRERSNVPTQAIIQETGQTIWLPEQEHISFGRLAEHNGMKANDVVLQLPEPEKLQQISRWHFELRRQREGFQFVSLTNQLTEVDGRQLARGEHVPLSIGATVRLAGVMTLVFAGPVAKKDTNATRLAGE